MRETIKQRLNDQIDSVHLDVDLQGNHCTLVIVSDAFEGLGPVKRQQAVYACLQDLIASGELHAINITALTPSQWLS